MSFHARALELIPNVIEQRLFVVLAPTNAILGRSCEIGYCWYGGFLSYIRTND